MGLFELGSFSFKAPRGRVLSSCAVVLLVAVAVLAPVTAAPSSAAGLSKVKLAPPRIHIFGGPSGGVELLDLPIPGLDDLLIVDARRSTKDAVAAAGSCGIIGGGERRFAEKINRARQRRDLGNVRLDREISFVAGAHSRAMKREDDVHHTPDGKLRDRVTNWVLLGENVGRGPDVDRLHRAFMNSETHRQVILHERYVNVGVGIAGDDGRIWATVLFESRNDPGTTMKLPAGC